MSDWRPIKTAPNDGTMVDLYVASRKERLTNYCLTANNKMTDWFYEPVYGGRTCVRDATHWMPLPEPPKERG